MLPDAGLTARVPTRTDARSAELYLLSFSTTPTARPAEQSAIG